MEIEFIHSKTYDQILSQRENLPKIDFFKKINGIKEEWKKYEKDILNEISKLTNLKWKETNIKCYVVTNSIPFSEPLTIPAYKKIDLFIDVLIHELIHSILNRNNYRLSKEAWDYIFDKYKNESLSTKLHIPLHAIHSHIYLKFFNRERMIRDIKKIRKHSNGDYKRSWEIVQKE